MKKKTVSLLLAFLMALTVCGNAALACGRTEAGVYHHGHGSHHGGRGHHGKAETCEWLYHACGDCADVYCEDHAHRCPVDCANAKHRHYGVRQYADGTLELMKK